MSLATSLAYESGDLFADFALFSLQSIGAFFDLLRRVLRNAGRDALNAQLKSTFAFFLTAFDLRWTLRTSLSVEVSPIGRSFLSCSSLTLLSRLILDSTGDLLGRDQGRQRFHGDRRQAKRGNLQASLRSSLRLGCRCFG